jgi:nucleoside-diphosphate-sugar epimerase
MKAFVTGATGVVGRRAVPLLVAHGHNVRALARTPEQRDALARQGAAALAADLFDPPSLRSAVRGCDVVINLATHLPASTYQFFLRSAWQENDRIRSIGSANLAHAASAEGVGRFIQESFAPIYEDSGNRWIHEDGPVRPAHYNRSVLDAERSANAFTERGGIGVVLRFSLFYGPDSFTTRDAAGMVRKGWSPLLGDPAGFVSSISHDDAASAVVAALGVPRGTYNATDDEPVTRREYVDTLAAALRVPPPRFLPGWLLKLTGSVGETISRSLRISNATLRGSATWTPRYPSVREGLPAALREMQTHPK